MAANRDMETVANAIKSLGDESMEVSLCLLTMLLPYQLRLEGLKANPTPEEAAQLAADFTQFLTDLRDELLGE